MSKTQLTAKQLFERRNTTDVFNRLVIMAVLRILNRKLVYEQVWSDDEDGIQNVTVPFFYDFGGGNINSLRFIQDNYTHFSDTECTDIGLKKIDGNFDFYPQGRIALTSVSIDSGNITNRFAMANFTRMEDGQPHTYTSYLYSIPLQFSFSLEIRCDTMNTAFKIDLACREFFYKNQTVHFNYRGTIVPVRIGFPESQFQGQTALYTMGSAPNDNWIKLSMNLQAETYQPVFDKYKEQPADVSIYNAGVNIWVNNTLNPESTPHRTGTITMKTNFKDLLFISGQDVLLQWTESYMDRDLLMVDICYQIEGDENEYMIASVDNHHFYHWEIPHGFTENQEIDIMIPNSDYCSVATPPEIYIYPDPTTHLVDTDNVYIKNKGFFIAPKSDFKVEAIISYTDKNDEIIETPATLNLNNFMIDTELQPIEFECFPFENDINVRKIRLIVKDHYKKENKAISDWFSVI